MNERSTISAGISVSVGEVSPVYFSLNLRPPRELSLGFGTIKASSWRCSGLLPGVSQYSIVQKLFCRKCFPYSPGSQSSLGALSPRELSLGFGTIKASSWRCSDLLPGVSPVFDRTETILGEIFSPLARLPELSLGALPPPRARSRVRYHPGIFLAL